MGGVKLEQVTCPDCGTSHLVEEIDRAKFFRYREPRCVSCQAAWDTENPQPIEIKLIRTVVANPRKDLGERIAIDRRLKL